MSMPPLLNDAPIARFSHQPGILRSLLELFLDTSSKTIYRIEAGVEEENLEQIAFHAHSLKGTAVELGADDLAELCQKVQLMAKTADKTSTFALVKDLLNCYKETVAALLALDFE